MARRRAAGRDRLVRLSQRLIQALEHDPAEPFGQRSPGHLQKIADAPQSQPVETLDYRGFQA